LVGCFSNVVKDTELSVFMAYLDSNDYEHDINSISFTKENHKNIFISVSIKPVMVKNLIKTNLINKTFLVSTNSNTTIVVDTIHDINYTDQGYAEITVSGRSEIDRFFADHTLRFVKSTFLVGFVNTKNSKQPSLKIIPNHVDFINFDSSEDSKVTDYLFTKAIKSKGMAIPINFDRANIKLSLMSGQSGKLEYYFSKNGITAALHEH